MCNSWPVFTCSDDDNENKTSSSSSSKTANKNNENDTNDLVSVALFHITQT